jgi:uncharacterized membrane protein
MGKILDSTLAAVGGAGLGAGLLYLMDGNAGGTRRARLRDKAVHAAKEARDTLGMVASDLAGRSHGIRPRLRHALRRERVDDRVLAERVRSKLGRYVSHPRSIGVQASDGRVSLAGHILSREAPALLTHIRRVPGVRQVEDALERHDKASGVPGLQGGGTRRGERFELMQASWSPAWRLAVAASGAALAVAGIRRGGPQAWIAGTAGAGLLARSWFNEPLARIFGIGTGPAAIRLQKTINIDAPVELVFRMFASYDNFPLYMPHVKEVRDLGEGRSHWKVQAIPGASVEWEAEITELIADRSLGWTSLAGSSVPNAGIMRFSPNRKGGTTVDIKLGYHPPAGEVGHAFARLLGADPKRKMDRDLMIMKDFIERHAAATSADGKAAAKAAEAGGRRPEESPAPAFGGA